MTKALDNRKDTYSDMLLAKDVRCTMSLLYRKM